MYRCIMYAVVCVIAVLLTACSAIENKKKTEKPPVAVTIAVAGANEGAADSQSYSGTLTDNYSAQLSFQTGGRLTKVYVSEGDAVKRGMRLADVDNTQAVNALKTAEATLAQAVDGYKRLKALHDSGSISEVKWVEMETKLKQAQSTAQMARKNLDECTLRAPFDGIVSARYFDEGTRLLPSQAVMEIINTDTMMVKISVPENDISSIKIGSEALVQVLSLDNETFKGNVTAKGVDADRLSHTYTVKVAVPNIGRKLMSGMVCKCTLYGNQPDGGYIIPYQAVQLMQDGNYVWCVKDGKTTRRKVTTAGFAEGGVIIKDGISQGDTIVVEGRQKVYEGCAVAVQ